MSIHYQCRYCNKSLGTLSHSQGSALSIGLEQLSLEERQNFVSFLENGNILIKSICIDCEQAFKENPIYYEYDTFLQ